MITFSDIKNNDEINEYIRASDETLAAIGYTDHSFGHVCKVADTARYILETLGFPKRDVELAQIASYLHDIGNLINRVDHAHTGAEMTFGILSRLGMSPSEISDIVSAIGHHDEGTAEAVTPIAAALIIGDKTDVRRTRVRNHDVASFDIHDRVNYAVKDVDVIINKSGTILELKISIDTSICSVMNYFEIFLDRMLLCKKACEKLNLKFCLVINDQQIM